MRRAGRCLLVLMGLAVPFALTVGEAAGAQVTGKVSGGFRIEITIPDLAGHFLAVDGGSVPMEVVQYHRGGLTGPTHELVGPVRYSDIVLQAGLSFPQMVQAAIPTKSDPDEIQRLEDLLDRMTNAEAYHLLFVNFDPRALTDDDPFFDEIPEEVFLRDGCETFLITLGIPDPVVLDLATPNDPLDGHKLRKVFDPARDSPQRLVLDQRLVNPAPGNPTVPPVADGGMVASLEFFLDGVEEPKKEREAIREVKAMVQTPPKLRAPPKCVLTWGSRPSYQCILEKFSLRFTLFKPDGIPVRAKTDVEIK